MFVVKYMSKGGAKVYRWKPKGEKYVCNEFEARSRFRHLVAAGASKEKVDGIIPYLVTIEDVRVEVPKVKIKRLKVGADGILGGANKALCMIQYADKEGAPMGPWAGMAAAN